MDLAVKLLIVGLVVVALWRLLQPRSVFVIRIAGGQARATRGKVTPLFLQQIIEASARSGVASGWVSGTQRGKRVVLVFSRNIPAGCQQRIRNAWVVGG
jgi:hypothetical protein